MLRLVYPYLTVEIGGYAVSFWLPALVARVGGLCDAPTVLAGGRLAAAGPAVALSFRRVGQSRGAPTSAVMSVEGA